MLVSAKKQKLIDLMVTVVILKRWGNNWVLTSLHPIKLFSRSLKYLLKTVCCCIKTFSKGKEFKWQETLALYSFISATCGKDCVCWPDFAHFVAFSHFKLSAMCLSKSCVIFFHASHSLPSLSWVFQFQDDHSYLQMCEYHWLNEQSM